MKKIALIIAALGTTLAFTACQDSADDHPTLIKTDGKVVDILNAPEVAGEALVITQDNKDESLHMTCVRLDDYGFQAPIRYEVQVSLSPDFATPVVEDAPAAVVLPTSFQNNEAINPSYAEIGAAMRDMLGIEMPDQLPSPQHKLYIRLLVNVITTAGQPYQGTDMITNVVTVDNAQVTYMDVTEAGRPSGIFLRGGMNGWGSPSDWQFLTTSTPGVYEIDECTIDAGTEFKVADAAWSKVNYGLNSAEVKFNEPITLDAGGANITMPQAFTGRVQLTIAGGSCTIVFDALQPDVPGLGTGVYLRGDFNGWDSPAQDEFLTTDIKNRWSIASVTIDGGTFKVADANWSAINYGGNGNAIEPGVAYELKAGGDNIAIDGKFTGTASIKIKDGVYYLTLTPAAE